MLLLIVLKSTDNLLVHFYFWLIFTLILLLHISFQGTFSVYEKLDAVNKFVRESLFNEELPFILTTPTGLRLCDEDADKSLTDLRLIPATVLTFSWDPSIVAEMGSSGQDLVYLKQETMLLLQPL